MSQNFVYILTNPSHTVLYVGMTHDLPSRIAQHKMKSIEGFTKKYDCTTLIYFESTPDRDSALIRERELKGWSRNKKVALIMMSNPMWRDLGEELESL